MTIQRLLQRLIDSLLYEAAKDVSYQEKKRSFFIKICNIRGPCEVKIISLEDLHPPPLPIINLEDLHSPPLPISLRGAIMSELQSLFTRRNSSCLEDNEYYKNLSDEEKELFYKFLDYFSVCPICLTGNHEGYIAEFFFDQRIQKEYLKKSLLNLMKTSKGFENIYKNKIIIGIPCCDCFKKFFKEY